MQSTSWEREGEGEREKKACCWEAKFAGCHQRSCWEFIAIAETHNGDKCWLCCLPKQKPPTHSTADRCFRLPKMNSICISCESWSVWKMLNSYWSFYISASQSKRISQKSVIVGARILCAFTRNRCWQPICCAGFYRIINNSHKMKYYDAPRPRNITWSCTKVQCCGSHKKTATTAFELLFTSLTSM